MIRKVIKYQDFEGNDKEKAFYFNISKAEAIELEMSNKGGLQNTIQLLIDTQDTEKVYALIKGIVLQAYGIKSPDGERFIKSQQTRDEFEQTNAFSELMAELLTDSTAAANFINGLAPQAPQSKPIN